VALLGFCTRLGAGTWRALPPLPYQLAAGGAAVVDGKLYLVGRVTGAAVVHGQIVSVGGEAPAGTIASVYAYSLARARWRRPPDLPTPRHGLALAALGGRIYAIAGGRTPRLPLNDINESRRQAETASIDL
jgi:hypothetical protein